MKIKLISAFVIVFTSLNGTALAEEIPAEQEQTISDQVELDDTAAQDVAAQEPEEQAPLPLNELRKFADVFGKIKAAYVEEIDDTALLQHAIKGMLSGLDPHSAYLEPTAYDDLKVSTSGSFGGLGIEVGMENGFVKVIAPIDETPAQLGGIQAGDLIIELDSKPVKGLSLDQAVDKMRGEVGTKIKIKLVRSGTREPIQMTLTRAEIRTPSIRSMVLDDHYGYLRVSQFQANSGEQFANKLTSLKEDAEELRGLIIDLRNNPGGVLQAAVQMADELLDEGLIVYTKGRSEIAQLSFSAEAGDSLEGKPVIVLIDGGSASASEILAGALQDHDRAVIMGTQSFGKGSVQNILQLDEDHALKLTTARYYTPNGRSIQAQGIVPDIIVNRAKLSDKQEQDFYREADLEGHLSNDGSDSDAEEDNELNADQKRRKDLLERDFQLQEAISLLKAIDILKIEI